MAENRFRRRMTYRPPALHATQVMDTVHQQDLTPPSSSTECSDLHNRDRRPIAHTTAPNGGLCAFCLNSFPLLSVMPPLGAVRYRPSTRCGVIGLKPPSGKVHIDAMNKWPGPG
jgi:hypothetical protein